ncbi:MAG: AI-2E family transporter [Anaerolineales bacterium]|nr:AI-2E family transporter [Anaerolineales bacterium]
MSYQWSPITRAFVAAISLVIIGLFIWVIRPMIEPIMIAILLAYILNPLVRLVTTHTRLPHGWAVALVYFSCLTLLIVIPSTFAPVAVRQLTGLTTYLIGIEAELEELLANPIILFNQQIYLGQLLSDLLRLTTESFTPAPEGALAVIERTSTSFAWLIVILVSTYYLLLDGERLVAWLVRLAPEQAQPDLSRLFIEIDVIWWAYLRGTLVLMLIVGITFMVVWTAIGLPGALALGLLTGVLTVIPEVGPTIAAILAVLVALFQGSDFLPISNFWFALLVFGIYFVLIQIKAIWLRPRVMGYFLNMNEGLIFVAIIGAVVLWGIMGALLIVPLLATLGSIAHYVRCRLLNLDPWPEDVTYATSPPIELPSDEELAHTFPDADRVPPVPPARLKGPVLPKSETN